MLQREYPIFAKVSVGAKHYGSKSLLVTNKLSAVMLRPSKIGMHPVVTLSATGFPACFTQILLSCGTGILSVRKRLVENGATSQQRTQSRREWDG